MIANLLIQELLVADPEDSWYAGPFVATHHRVIAETKLGVPSDRASDRPR